MQGRGDDETELEFEEELVAGSDIHHFQRQVSKSSITSIWTVKCFCYRWKHKGCSFYETWLCFFFFPAYIEAKKKEVLFCLMIAEQTACCTVGEEGVAALLAACTCCVLLIRCMACLIHMGNSAAFWVAFSSMPNKFELKTSGLRLRSQLLAGMVNSGFTCVLYYRQQFRTMITRRNKLNFRKKLNTF